MTHNYSKLPAIVTIKNVSGDTLSIPLYRTNLYYSLPAEDELVIRVTASTELIYLESLKDKVSGITVAITQETTTS